MSNYKRGDVVVVQEGCLKSLARVERANRFYAWVGGCAYRQRDGHEKGAPRPAAYLWRVPWRWIYRPTPEEREQLEILEEVRGIRTALSHLKDDPEARAKCRAIRKVLGI
jgi:hypothetical protein